MAVKKEIEAVNNKILSVVDVGYSFTKILSSVKREMISFPSAVSINPNAAMSTINKNTEIKTSELMVDVDGVKAYLGERALIVPEMMEKRTIAADRSKDLSSQLLFRTAIALSLPDESGVYEDIHLVTGLPNKDYDKSINQDLVDFLLQPFTIKMYINNREYVEKEIKVSSVTILRQPYGTYSSHQYAFGNVDNGEPLIVKTPNYKDVIGIFDIGHLTTDYCVFMQGDILLDSKTVGSTSGVRDVYIELEEKLEEYLDELGMSTDVKEKDLDNAVMNKVISRTGEDLPVDDEVKESIQLVVPDMVSKIFKKWNKVLEDLELVLSTGGGAELFEESLKEQFELRTKQSFTKVDDAQFANVLGYYIEGVRALAEEIGEQAAYEEYVA